MTANKTTYRWAFAPRFRRNAFGWRSQPAIARIKEALSEIKKVARKDPGLGAEGAVLFLEKISPALSHVDSSSGAIGAAVNNAIGELVPIIAKALVGDAVRDVWLERLWDAVEEDNIPYIELLPDYWGELCVTPERAAQWADNMIDLVRLSWSPDPTLRGHCKGTEACLSCLVKAGRYDEILELLQMSPYKWWDYRRWGVKALMAMGRKQEALRYAEDSRGINDSPVRIAMACEEILLSSGMVDEAYDRYAMEANKKGTNLATFRAIREKYPHKSAGEVLRDLVEESPGSEGKWFAAAKSAELYKEAIELANLTPCDPRTLTRAARDMAAKEPGFAVEAGMAALRWLVEGYGFDITGADVWDTYHRTMEASEKAGCKAETFERIRNLVAASAPAGFVQKVLGPTLGLTA